LIRWYESTIGNWDEDTVKYNRKVAELAARECKAKFNIGFEGEDGIQSILAIYSFAISAIFEELSTFRSKRDEFEIHIGEIVAFGYDNSKDDGESEKLGNFCPTMKNLENGVELQREGGEASMDLCTKWTSANIKDMQKTWDNIAERTLELLAKEVDLHLGTPWAIIPIVAVVQTQLCGFAKCKREDNGDTQFKFLFAAIINVIASLQEDGSTLVEFMPTQNIKLGIKSDREATSVKENLD
jgi:hypothetical protein